MRATQPPPTSAVPQPGYTIEKWDRSWKVLDPSGELVYFTLCAARWTCGRLTAD
jgi:hypothetical protein